MTIQDVFEVTIVAERVGVTIRNTYFYRQDSGGGDAQELALSIESDLLPLVLALQHSQVTTTGINVRNLFDISDTHELELAEVGLVATSEAMPDFVAIGLTLEPASSIVNPGSKRIGGLAESISGGGRTVDPAFTAAVLALTTQIALTIAGGGFPPALFSPVIVGRIFDLLVGTDGGYRLPTTLAEATAEGLALVVRAIDKGIRSQKSRRFGIGE